MIPGFLTEAGRGLAHGVAQGTISTMAGGEFLTGFASGTLSSWASSGYKLSGLGIYPELHDIRKVGTPNRNIMIKNVTVNIKGINCRVKLLSLSLEKTMKIVTVPNMNSRILYDNVKVPQKTFYYYNDGHAQNSNHAMWIVMQGMRSIETLTNLYK